MIRVLVAEDQTMVRGALAALLELEADLSVVAQVERGDEVLDAARRERPDVALLDIEMPGGDGLEAAEALARELPGVRSLVLTTFARPGYLRRAMASGAAGFLLKTAPVEELGDRDPAGVAAGERVVDPGLAAEALSAGDSPLTAREQDVLRRGAQRRPRRRGSPTGCTCRPGTVRNYLSSAMQKLDAAAPARRRCGPPRRKAGSGDARDPLGWPLRCPSWRKSMRRSRSIRVIPTLVLAVLAFAAAPAIAAAAERFVATTGDDAANTCAVEATPCRTIQHAVDVSHAADIVNVADPGPRSAQLAINSSVSGTPASELTGTAVAPPV